MKADRDYVFKKLPISCFVFDRDLPRKYFDENKLTEMSESIKERGVLQPIMVRPDGDNLGKYKVIMGKRRLKSALLAKLQHVPCFIEDVGDQEALELALIENIQREDLSPFEEGWGILRLINQFGYTVEEVSKKLKKSGDFVRNRLRLMSLPEEVQKHIATGKLGKEHAAHLADLRPADQPRVAKEIMKNQLTNHQARELVLEQLEKTKDKKVGLMRKSEVTAKKIMVQARVLKRLVERSDLSTFSYVEKEDLKSDLKSLRGFLDDRIKVLEDLILNDD